MLTQSIGKHVSSEIKIDVNENSRTRNTMTKSNEVIFHYKKLLPTPFRNNEQRQITKTGNLKFLPRNYKSDLGSATVEE